MNARSVSKEVIGYSKAPFCIPEEDLISPLGKASEIKKLDGAELSRENQEVGSGASVFSDLVGVGMHEENKTGDGAELSYAPPKVDSDTKSSADLEVDRLLDGRSASRFGKGLHAKAPWSSLFKDNRKEGLKLNKILSDTAGPVFVEEEFKDEKDWELCLIGCVGGAFPGMGALKQTTKNWKGRHKAQLHDSGWIVFQFEAMEDLVMVLLEGPYFINGKPLMLKRMPKFFSFGYEEMHVVPIWVRFINLPLILWKERYLSKIASYLGNPISTDQITARKGNFNYARVLIEVDISKELPKSIAVTLPDRVHNLELFFEKVPLHCSTCGRIGHTNKGHDLFMKDEKGRRNHSRKGGRLVNNVGLSVDKVKSVGDGPGDFAIVEPPLDVAVHSDPSVLVASEFPDGAQQAEVYLQAHSQEKIEEFLNDAFEGIGLLNPELSTRDDFGHGVEEDASALDLEGLSETHEGHNERFVKVLSKKEKRRRLKALKDHPSMLKDKVPFPPSQ